MLKVHFSISGEFSSSDDCRAGVSVWTAASLGG